MSFNPEAIYYSTQAWSKNDPAVKYNLRLLNTGGLDIYVKKFYIKNVISNPQEVNSIFNFCIVFNNLDYTNITNSNSINSIIGTSNNYEINYPSYYGFEPGNVNYSDYLYTSSFENYKATKTFTLSPSDYLSFDLVFNPLNRNIDFYRGEIVCEFTKHGSSVVHKKINKINADYLSNIDSVDGKDFGELILSMNGIPIQDILIAQ